MNAVVHPLRLEATVEVSRVGHRLALGVQWLDALTQLPIGGALVSELEGIGSRALPLRLELHPQARHALLGTGRLAKLLAIAAEEKLANPPATPAADPTNLSLHCFALRDPTGRGYGTANDPRHHVPRRLALIPLQSGGIPVATTGNIRQAWLWPGANYPLSANCTAVRGRIRRGPNLADASPVAWGRVIFTRPANLADPADFAGEAHVGWAHGDDRGEFVAVLGAQAVPGGATLPATLTLRAWVFLPPAGGVDPADPLASLPLEQAGTDSINDVLRGIAPPPDYLPQAHRDVVLRPGEVFVMSDAVLLFP